MNRLAKLMRKWQFHTLLFAALSAFLLLFVQLGGHKLLPFNAYNYEHNSHHYDKLAPDKEFNLPESLGVFDSNFYIFMADRMADGGWQNEPSQTMTDKGELDSLAFAFAPLYPAVLALFNLLIHNVVATAFIANFVLAVTAFAVFWRLVNSWYGTGVASKAAWLMALSPAAVFLHLYFTEGLTILLMALLLWAYRDKKYLWAAVLTGLLCVARFQMLVLVPLLVIVLVAELYHKRIKFGKVLAAGMLSILPMTIWVGLVWLWTGSPLYFIEVRSEWGAIPLTVLAAVPLMLIGKLPFHFFHSSVVDTVSIILSGALLGLSRKWLPRVWWWTALLVWVFPLFTTDTMSGMRYQLVLLPLYIFVAAHVKNRWFYWALPLLVILQFFMITAAINYYWIG